jgi:phosphatidylserine/phosphatidylglycerophosphate/cardiolipin synthase-like enzyme
MVLAGMAFAGVVLFGASLLRLEYPAAWAPTHVQMEPSHPPSAIEAHSPSVTTCFTPAQACADLIVGILDHARSQIRLQAYGFTSSPILAALVAAKQRGVDVVVILDKSDERASSASGADYVVRAGIPVFIDYQPAIAHNKVIVVDKHTVVTGSYNFTAAAERKNTENVTIIDAPAVATRFLSNWESRRALSRPFVGDDR